MADRAAPKIHLFFKWFAGPVGQELTTVNDYNTSMGPVGYETGTIAGSYGKGPIAWMWNMPVPHDGKVTVASSHVAGETDHIVLPVSHTLMPLLPSVIAQVLAFIKTGRFNH